jgi:hypothetical protein
MNFIIIPELCPLFVLAGSRGICVLHLYEHILPYFNFIFFFYVLDFVGKINIDNKISQSKSNQVGALKVA